MTTYKLGSSPAVYAPGLVRWAMSGYWNEPDRAQLRNVIASTWSIPDDAAGKLLNKDVTFIVEDETVVFAA
jgi:hypothetical protein